MTADKLSIEPVWADSLGAKTVCTFVETPEINVLIDPGVSVMQPSFPASWAEKYFWKARGWVSIINALDKADVVIISHYHHDHYMDNYAWAYGDKQLIVKNPNEYINNSQMDRAKKFLQSICRFYGDIELEKVLEERKEKEYDNPMKDIPHARDKDFGDYNSRREELIEKWLDRYWNRVNNWKSSRWIPELDFDNISVSFAEGKSIDYGKTKIRFKGPLFHGIELSNTGWVVSTIIEREDEKFVHTSDLQGPTVEDYADWIIEENPNMLYLDGPATYLLGYMLNKINLNRAIENAVRIIRNTDLDLMWYDHHLLREEKFRERTEKVWEIADELDISLGTVAGYRGDTPVISG